MRDRIEGYIREHFAPEDDVLSSFKAEAEAAGLPLIQTPPELGKLLALLVRLGGARRVLEIGTLGGYSAAWMARAMPPDARLVTLELDPKHAEFARGFLHRAGVADQVEVVVGPALETLPAVGERAEPPFDLMFIDADKDAYLEYLDWGLRLVRPGGVIVADNTLRGGRVLEPGDDSQLRALAEYNRRVASSPLLVSTLLPNRGGEDGITISVLSG